MFIKKYFKESAKTHGGYAINFFLCEILALVNVIGQMYLTDRYGVISNKLGRSSINTDKFDNRFLGYEFTTYGWDVLSVTAGNPEERADPMNIVFPKVQITYLVIE